MITSNLQGRQSPRAYFRAFPAVHVFPYQCSPMSSSDAIQRQFDMACRYQAHATEQLAVLLLLHLCYSLLRRCVALSSIVHTLGLVLLLARFCLLSQLPLSASVPVRTRCLLVKAPACA